MNSAQILLDKIGPHPSKASKRISANKAVEDFANHLDWLCSRHVKKSYNQSYLVGWVFGTKRTFNKKSEADGYCRANLLVANRCFKDLLVQMRGGRVKITSKSLQNYSEIVRSYVFDLKPVAEHLERQKDKDYVLFVGWQNYGVHTWEVFRVSRQLAIQSAFRGQLFHMDFKTSQIASVFVLRQALEAKFFRLVGVEIYNKDGDSPKLRHMFHYDFIVSHPHYFTFRHVAFTDLKKIYEWCNDVVHHVYHAVAWELDFAHEICKGLFNPVSVPPGSGWSINNAVEIKKVDDMQHEFMRHFVVSYHHGIWAIEAASPEALCI